ATYSDYYYVVFLIALTILIVVLRWLTVNVHVAQPPRRLAALDWLLVSVACVAIVSAVVIAMTGGGVVTIGSTQISLRSGHNLGVAFWCVIAILAWRRWRPWLRIFRSQDTALRRDSAIAAIAFGVFALGSAPVFWLAFQLWQRGDYVTQVYMWRS